MSRLPLINIYSNEKGCNAVLELTLEGIVTNALADAKRAMKAKERNILYLFVSL